MLLGTLNFPSHHQGVCEVAVLLGSFRLNRVCVRISWSPSLLSVLEGGDPGPSASLGGLACICALGFHLVALAQLLQALQKGLPGLRHAPFQQPALALALGVFGIGHTFQRRVQVAQPSRGGHLVGGEET